MVGGTEGLVTKCSTVSARDNRSGLVLASFHITWTQESIFGVKVGNNCTSRPGEDACLLKESRKLFYRHNTEFIQAFLDIEIVALCSTC